MRMRWETARLLLQTERNDATTQASQIDTFIAQDVDAIILTAAVSDPMLPSIKKINDAGIPLIIVDRRILPQGQDVNLGLLCNLGYGNCQEHMEQSRRSRLWEELEKRKEKL